MFELEISRVFSAAHAIAIRGVREPLHGHDWRVTVVVGGESLDDDGLLCDFHELEAALDEIIAPFRNANLNETPPFHEVNPTAERVAEHIAHCIIARRSRAGLSVKSVSVTEAPGCRATFRAI